MQISSRRAKGTAVAVGLGAVLAAASLAPANAASHREAPLISMDPVADNTDTYAFVSPGDNGKVTLIANWVPFQDPFAGPNFYKFGDDVLYSIHVDNDGDAVPNITYEWRFTTVNDSPGIPVYAANQITDINDPFNQKQTYSLSKVEDGVRTMMGEGLPVPPYNTGFRTLPDYDAVANQAIVDVAGVTTFAGPRDETFAADLGSIFDLGGLRPFGEAHLIPLAQQPGVNSLDGMNVHSIAIEVPTAELTKNGDDVIGVWSSTYRKKVKVFAKNSGAMPVHRGRWVQVSRLGNPLVNEVVVPISLKDTFNTLRPDQDAATLAGLQVEPFATEGEIPLVTDPILADLIEVLYPGVKTPADGTRTDLVSIFLTGIEGLNQQQGGVPAEMLRLNTSMAPNQQDPNLQNPLGVLGGDTDGFPNGRRLIDDVVDLSLRAVAGGTALSPDQSTNVAPNNALGDGVQGNDKPLLLDFPYIPAPHSGYDTGPNDGNIEGNGVDDNGQNPAG